MLRLFALLLTVFALSACTTFGKKSSADTAKTKPATTQNTTYSDAGERRNLTEMGMDNWNGAEQPADANDPVLTPKPVAVKTNMAPVASLPRAIMAEPVLLTFSRMSVKLDTMALLQIEKMSYRLRYAKQVMITGYCNRGEIGNAEAAARARAQAVKKELVKKGVPEGSIEVIVNVDEDRHAAMIELG